MSGWHATNQAANKPYHFIIILDRSDRNRELGRIKVTGEISRPDVAKAYPQINNADQAGFNVAFDLSKLNLNHQLQVISRYSDTSNGEGHYVDYWFNPIAGDTNNQGYLDSFDLSDGVHLKVSGWHANDISQLESHHFLILFDDTTKQQVAVQFAQSVSRPDVARAFSNIKTAGNSGYVSQFDLAKLNLQVGHRYSIVNRYSTSDQGNGDQGQYTDFWSQPILIKDQQAHWFDQLQMTTNGIHLAGWMVDTSTLTKPYAYAIVLNNGREVTRTQLNLASRPDVATVYPIVVNSLHSGFDTLIKLNPADLSGNVQVLLRFTDDPVGNGNYSDQTSISTPANQGNFDQINVSANNIYISGWHASNQSVNKPYQWLIFVDQNGHELYRQEVLDKNRARPDVAQTMPLLLNSGNSGFQLSFVIPSQLKGHVVRVIHRFTNDAAGNGNFVDLYSRPFMVGIMRYPIDYRQPSEYAPYPNISRLNNFWIHVKISANRVYLMNNNDVVYTMYCSAGDNHTTPTGVYHIQAERGNSFYNGGLGEGANYWTSFLDHGVYLFHTVPTDWRGNYKPGEAAKLGVSTGSHGCIRLSVPDAYWFMHNVPMGTKVIIDN